MLVGRVAERVAIDALTRRARRGHGQALVLHGEPGIGKTALLDHAARTSDGLCVLRTSGVQPEVDIGYAALHRLLVPVLAELPRIPRAQAAALEVVLGQSDGPTPDPFLVSLAVLSLLAEVATAAPLLCLVDDAQWVDGASLDVLGFVARRLQDEPLAIVFAVRADAAASRRLAGVPVLHVDGLDAREATELLELCHPDRLTPAQRHEVTALAAGNPLALKELPKALLDGRGAREPTPVPLTAELQDAFLDQVRQKEPRARKLLLLVAADGSGRRETVRAAAAALGLDVDDIGWDRIGDQIVDDGDRLELRHPLVRAAIYHGASPPERRAAHRALAAAVADDPVELHRHAWHLGEAAEERDEATAALLERSAQQASRRAGHGAAAAALRRAAELSESEELRARRTVAAATLSWQGGEVDRARDLLAEAERAERMPDDARLDLAELRARLELLVGTPADGLAPLRAAMPRALAQGPLRAMPLLMTYGEIGYRAYRPEAWADIDGWLDGVPLDGDTPTDALYRLLRGGSRVRVGKGAGVRDGDLAAIEELTDPVDLTRAAGLTWAVGAYDLGRRLRNRAVRQARTIGAAGTLAWSLEHLVFDALTRSRFSTAEAYAEEGHRLAVETGQPNTACRLLSLRTWLAALQGRADACLDHADAVLAEATARELAECAAYAHHSLGHLALAAGAYGEAVSHYDAAGGRRGPSSGPALHSVAELVEALVRADELDRAAEEATRLAGWAARAAAPELEALSARCHALLATGDEADAHFRRSLSLYATTDTPMEEARTALLYGQHLRRDRRRSEAQGQLRPALTTFRRIGADAWAKHAQEELRATGGSSSPDPDPPAVLATLTPQERRIALAISEGATNRDVAAQLFLSPRTVDYHLRKVFQKVGIRSRSELMRLVLTDSDRRSH